MKKISRVAHVEATAPRIIPLHKITEVSIGEFDSENMVAIAAATLAHNYKNMPLTTETSSLLTADADKQAYFQMRAPHYFETFKRDSSVRVFSIYDQTQNIAAFAVVSSDEDALMLVAIVTRRDFLNQGYAKTLFLYIEEEWRDKPIHFIASNDNTVAQNFYRHLGFVGDTSKNNSQYIHYIKKAKAASN